MEKIFEENPHLKVVHVTSDGQAFYNENDAQNHAKSLEVKTVEPVYNPKHIDLEGAIDETEEAKAMQEFEAAQKPIPAEETPAEETPAEQTPVEETPEEQTPAEETPAEQTPAEQTPATVVTTEKSGTVDLADLTKANLNEFAKLNGLTIADPKATNPKLIEEIIAQLSAKKAK